MASTDCNPGTDWCKAIWRIREAEKRSFSPTRQFAPYDLYYVRRSQIFPVRQKPAGAHEAPLVTWSNLLDPYTYNVMFCTRPKLHWDFFQAHEDAESTNRLWIILYSREMCFMIRNRAHMCENLKLFFTEIIWCKFSIIRVYLVFLVWFIEYW